MMNKKEKINLLAKKLNIEIGDDNRAIIRMKVVDDDEFLSKYFYDDPIISNEVADYLFGFKKQLRFKGGVKLEIISNCIDEQEQVVYRHAIKNYFLKDYEQVRNKIKIHNLLSLILFGLGVLTFIFMVIFSTYFSGNLGIWTEVIDVIAWVFIWQAVDLFVIQRLDCSARSIMDKNGMSCEIVFLPFDNNKDGKK